MSRQGIIAALVLAAAVVVAGGYVLWQQTATPPADEAIFQVIVIKEGKSFAQQQAEATEAGGTVPPELIDFAADSFTFPLAEVERNRTGSAFLALMRTAPRLAAAMEGAAVLRVRDGKAITAEGGDALAGDNGTVLVIPGDIVAIFDSERTAFQLIRMRVTGIQD
jgi:hypothetical protein